MNSAIRRMLVALLLVCLFRHAAGQTPTVAESESVLSEDLLEKSLEELMEIPVSSTSLTPIQSNRFNPSAVTVITQQDIQNSGARDLFELLEVYVPGFQWIFHGAKPRHFAIRGMMSSRDDKNLLLVNGRQMNERTDLGVYSERDLPLLRDIYKIEVVRGSGSALYGPGALSMVINIVTDTPKTYQGSEVNMRTGLVEEHYTAEFKWSKLFNDNEGLLLYGGASIYPGADQSDSAWRPYSTPLKVNNSTVRLYEDYYTGNRMEHYNAAYDDDPRMKFHMNYIKGNWSVWMRYTQGGEYVTQSEYGSRENGRRRRDIKYAVGYRQATIATDYKQELEDNFTLNYHTSYDRTNIETVPYRIGREDLYREDKYLGRILANWDIHDNHQVAFGTEFRHDEYGLDPDGWDETLNYVMSGGVDAPPREMPRWGTNMYSLLGEYQWTIMDNLKFFLGIRQDDHSFVEHMVSPRASLAYAFDEKNTFKAMFTKSSRMNVAEELKRSDLTGNSNSEYETLKARELRWEHQYSKQFWLAAGIFTHDHDLVSWTGSWGNGPVAHIKSHGFEVEAKYKDETVEVILSHAYTGLDHASLEPGIVAIEETLAPNGYGSDFANWSNHQSKLHVNYKLTAKWLLTNSVVINWGYPGGEDYAKYQRALTRTTGNHNIYNMSDEAFDRDVYWNMGVQFEYSKNLTFRADAYNVLGWFDKDLAQRRFGFTSDTPAAVRLQPAAFGFQMLYKF